MSDVLSKEQIYERIREILIESFELDADEIRLDAHLIDDLDLDSIDAIDLAVGLEQEIDLQVDEKELRAIRQVGDIVNLVHARMSEAAVANS